MQFEHKTILITGASTGIGRELAIQFAKKNNTLYLIARRKELLEQLVAELPGDQHVIFTCDVSLEQDIAKVCETIINELTVPDCIIFNAGMSNGFDCFDIDMKKIKYLYEVNLFNTFHFLKYFLPKMKDKKSIIAFTGSLAGYRGMPKAAPYSSSKAALMTLVSSLRIDLYKTPIKLSLISPGFVKTPMTDKNKYPMPFMISVEKAAKIIINGLEKEKFEIHFPLRFSFIAKLGKILPERFYIWLLQNRR